MMLRRSVFFLAIGAVAFVISAATSLFVFRSLRSRSSGASEPASPAPEPAEADPAADPSYNPYARED